ncbi:hypothetical protein IFM89_005227 [Coptis chinensis]|uniref:Homeobox domain-containing protein n=1 Tax=Coptis chinensis TaxID=261450 RepID=A0A835H1S5_9MAGN|nr:hypothetical protein IFM89_005227 [Coptis chinensis]
MSESCEVLEEDKFHPENNKKRTLKTPSQLEALEKLYNEHKYPTESIKAQLAEEIGLSEKQVSGWFCHRRLKDKNMLIEARLIGRQDFSSGIIQDRCSALKQDSCSSTKPGDYKHVDPREVESRRFCGQDSPTEDLTYRSMGRVFISSSNFPLTKNKDWKPKPRGHMVGSEYSNSQKDIENAAILAVKRQLGRHYREDGPALGVKFETLPPSAFDLPIADAINGPYYVGDSIVPNNVGVLKVHKQPTLDTGYTKYNHVMHPHNSHLQVEHLKQTGLGPDHRDGFNGHNSLQTDFSNYSHGQYFSVGSTEEDPAGVANVSNKSRRIHGVSQMHGVEGMRSDSVSNRILHPYDAKVITKGSSHPKLHNRNSPSSQRLHNLKDRSPMIVQYDECLGTERRQHSGMVKEEKLYGERRKSEKFTNSIKVKMQQKSDRSWGKTSQSDEYLPQYYASTTPSPNGLLPRGDQIKGYVGEMPTSFSDDETALTSSSMDSDGLDL